MQRHNALPYGAPEPLADLLGGGLRAAFLAPDQTNVIAFASVMVPESSVAVIA